jgi:hypothetical protein
LKPPSRTQVAQESDNTDPTFTPTG